jgi:hypothetical protein
MKYVTFVCLLALGVPIRSVANTIHFDEFGASSVLNANNMHVLGVTFNYAPDQLTYTTDQLIYNESIGTSGTVLLLTDPVLVGPTTGTLLLTFDFPTSLLQFDVVLLSLATVDDSSTKPNGGPAYSVASNGMVLNGSTTPQSGGLYSEGEFHYSGTPITRAAITFFNGTDINGSSVDAFGLDNLTFNAPEPGTIILLAGGLIVLGLLGRRQASQSSASRRDMAGCGLPESPNTLLNRGSGTISASP